MRTTAARHALPLLTAGSLALVACSNGAVKATDPLRVSPSWRPSVSPASPSPSPRTTATAHHTAPGPAVSQLLLTPLSRTYDEAPTGFVAPSCSEPSTVFSWVPISPAGKVAAASYPAEQRLKAGTNHSVEASAWAYPAAKVNGWIRGTIPQPKGRKIVFLTFDDGPSGVTTPQVQAVLRAKKVHATFFVVGRQVNDTDANLLRQSVADGNAIAVHSYGHDYKYLFPHGRASASHVGCDLSWAQDTLTPVLGKGYRPQAFRYPGGHLSWKEMPDADKVLAERGMSFIDWTSMTGDADSVMRADTVDEQVHNATLDVTKNHPGRNIVVLLQHDYYPNKVAPRALPGIIDHYRKLGYSFGIID